MDNNNNNNYKCYLEHGMAEQIEISLKYANLDSIFLLFLPVIFI